MTMPRNTSSRATDKKVDAEVADDMHPFLRRYKDGRVERLTRSVFVPASEAPGATGAATRDVIIDPVTGVSARLFLPVVAVAAATGRRRRLPVVVYFHGGAFCTGSAFADPFHRFAATLAVRAAAVVVSVDYRLAPEHPVPAAYDDAWTALRWVVASFSDPWLAFHADPARVFLAGDSAGANIVHNVAARLPRTRTGSIEGLILLHPFFWGPDRLSSETDRRDDDRPLFAPEWMDTLWPFLTAGAAGNDDHRINPPPETVASLPCRRALVAVAGKDVVRDRGCRYAAWLRRRRKSEVTLVESEGEDHGFHLYWPARASAVALMDRVVEFVNGKKEKKKTPSQVAADDIHPFLLRYKDGRVERLAPSTFVPASEAAGASPDAVATRDVVIDHATGVSARIFLSAGAVAAGSSTSHQDDAPPRRGLLPRRRLLHRERLVRAVPPGSCSSLLLGGHPVALPDGRRGGQRRPPADVVASLPCRRAFVAVEGKDVMRDRGRRHCRDVALLESEGKVHGFHLFWPERADAVALMDRVVQFISGCSPSQIADVEARSIVRRRWKARPRHTWPWWPMGKMTKQVFSECVELCQLCYERPERHTSACISGQSYGHEQTVVKQSLGDNYASDFEQGNCFKPAI
ncbi:hypothetical protein PR202_ga11432 [Eleusine coracana subsp. coracana]|uniref:Alpha/beta hydrolase fold-3 domain-containing protein n=1 Tax=Eleusine coracana subsp. coracana TaxID=191504 RepID=A0AAV5C9G8_ELECO|nr:hypothetical protein PR202_ga11432 [Eleusine coracana subsp. coracana]